MSQRAVVRKDFISVDQVRLYAQARMTYCQTGKWPTVRLALRLHRGRVESSARKRMVRFVSPVVGPTNIPLLSFTNDA
jgi:hypothetical protein